MRCVACGNVPVPFLILTSTPATSLKGWWWKSTPTPLEEQRYVTSSLRWFYVSRRAVCFLPGIRLLSQLLLYSVLCGLQASYWWAHNQSSACFKYTPTCILMWSGVVLRSKQQKNTLFISGVKGEGGGLRCLHAHFVFWAIFTCWGTFRMWWLQPACPVWFAKPIYEIWDCGTAKSLPKDFSKGDLAPAELYSKKITFQRISNVSF